MLANQTEFDGPGGGESRKVIACSSALLLSTSAAVMSQVVAGAIPDNNVPTESQSCPYQTRPRGPAVREGVNASNPWGSVYPNAESSACTSTSSRDKTQEQLRCPGSGKDQLWLANRADIGEGRDPCAARKETLVVSSSAGVSNSATACAKGVSDWKTGNWNKENCERWTGNNETTRESFCAAKADLSLVCPLHAYRFSLRDFDFGGFLGDGAHGCVFVARERRSGFVCVLKCITKAHLVRGGNEALLKKEVELQAHLKHPHICCMYTWFQTSSAIFLVMEYCLKGDLFALLDKTTCGFDERTVAKHLFQITWAIRTCHDKRIAHLDIKPENVLVNHKDQLKLADFGLSAHIGGEHRKRGVSIHRGTCDYFSPEQCTFRLRGAAMRAARAAAATADPATRQQLLAATLESQGEHVCSFDEKSDIWTIGILGFELYFKFPPFGSQCHLSEETVMHNVRNKHWSEGVEEAAATNEGINQKLRSMSNDFRSFLSACLNKKASLRPTAEALLEFPFLQKNNREIVNSVHFLQQPRHQQGHKGFNQPAGPWQTPRPTSC
ncbi:pek kinase [Cystoisospora suis]|uniref:Pek kinase n=1 Tax=Cystoisospora suis TaxID=483139 RepID=A0A2C6KYM7_9APIC|nr:pek kinase [Cystoisospora suis]